MKKKLIIVLGPTGVGKTELSLSLAEHLGCDIISCDSRQFYRELRIGTAAPDEDQLKRVRHHFVGMLELEDYYSCGRFETEMLKKAEELYNEKDTLIMVGGSMLYIDAITKGIDDRPEVDEELRNSLWERYEKEGIEKMRDELKMLDPKYYEQMDQKNYKRIIHALEICIATGKPYSDLRSQSSKKRDFDIIKIGLSLPREELYERINKRVDKMVEKGLIEEAKALYNKKDLNSLNTVGYKEIYKWMDGEWDKDHAIEMIKQDSRRYAKKQMTWFKRDEEITWFDPTEIEEVTKFIDEKLAEK